MWAPNAGKDFPYGVGNYTPIAGSYDFTLMDTNHDGILDGRDDAFRPFWPGDEYVDWVGYSVYSWGYGLSNGSYTTGLNIMPEANLYRDNMVKLVNFTKGAFPIMMCETAAYYVSNNPLKPQLPYVETSEVDLKVNWLAQVYNITQINTLYPSLKGIVWYNKNRLEAQTNQIVAWTIESPRSIFDEYTKIVDNAFFVTTFPQRQVYTPLRAQLLHAIILIAFAVSVGVAAFACTMRHIIPAMETWRPLELSPSKTLVEADDSAVVRTTEAFLRGKDIYANTWLGSTMFLCFSCFGFLVLGYSFYLRCTVPGTSLYIILSSAY
jgi:hypothetical protein